MAGCQRVQITPSGPTGGGAARRGALTVLTLVALTLCGTIAVSAVTAGPASAVPASAMTVSPSTGLADNANVSVVISGASPRSIYVIVECDPTAFTLLGAGESPADACDARHNAVVAIDAGGGADAVLQPQAVLTTSLGSSDCRAEQCFLAAESLYSTGGPALLLGNITFAATACQAPKSCTTPSDAWDPSLNPGGAAASLSTPPTLSASGTGTARARARAAARAASNRSATPGKPIVAPVTAGLAGSLTTGSAVTGPYLAAFPAPVVPPSPASGEGLLHLALSAPHTSWAGPHPSSTVVDVTLTDTTTSTVVGTQHFVLYFGSSPFIYGGFTGPVTTANTYQVTVTAEPPASSGGLSWPAKTAAPKATLVDSQLEVVAPGNPQYLVMTYAPVMYGRSTSALHDVPLLVDATATPAGGGATTLSYTVIWSHEDTGTGFVPFLEWGTWGRMTDIENAISFTVAADGSTSNASYLWGGEPATGFPDSQGAIQEVDVPFTGTWDGHHPVLRDATGNNDFSQQGTTPFRFQLAPVPGPAAGQNREAVMDANPFTYQISGEEVTRWYGDVSTNPQSPQPGDARQYATIDLDTSGSGVSSIAVELQLSGRSTWYASDLHTGYPAHGTGHVRTVVKLPSGWQSQPITGVRVQAYPSSAAPSVVISGLSVLALQNDWSVTTKAIPTPVVVAGATVIPTALSLTASSGTPQRVKAGGALKPLGAKVTDGHGVTLAGVPVTFNAGASGVRFTSCGCATVTAPTASNGIATSGPAQAPESTGPAPVTASTVDTVTPSVAFALTVR
jgi:hypothetical protein